MARLLGLAGRPAAGQAKPAAKKLDLAHIIPRRSRAAIALQVHVPRRSPSARTASSTSCSTAARSSTKELEIMDAVKSGNIAIGSPAGAACTVFPEMCVFLTPYLVRDYHHAYAMFNGEIGKSLDETFQKKYKVKILFFYDYGFRHFWNNKRADQHAGRSQGPQDARAAGHASSPTP